MSDSKIQQKFRKKGRPRQTKIESERISYLVWTDLIDGLSPEETGEKLGITPRAVASRRAKLKAFIDPKGDLLPTFRGAVNMLAVEAINTLHYHLTVKRDKDIAIRILESISVLKQVNEAQPAPTFNFQQWFGPLQNLSDGERAHMRKNIRAAFDDKSDNPPPREM